MRRNSINLAELDLVGKLDLVRSLKGRPERQHFVDDTSRRPNIAFLVIALLLDLFWAHVVRRANVCVGEDRLVSHHAAQPKIAKLYILLAIEEDITGF